MRFDGAIPVLVNPVAGSARGVASVIAHALADAAVPAHVQEVAADRLPDALREALRAGARVIGVAGGDGTISSAAALLAGRDAVLAPFPTGTLNHFARRLGLDDIDAAVRALRSGCTMRVPIGLVGTPEETAAGRGRRFVNNASCGFYPHVVRHREQLRPWLGKWPAALVAGIRVLLDLGRVRVVLELPGETLRRRVAALWVGLGRGSFTLPGEDEVKPGARQLEIVLPRAQDRLAFVGRGARVLWRLLRGAQPDRADVEILHAPTVTLEARRGIDIALDGEPLRLRPPITFRIIPEALEVVGEADR